MLPSCAAPSRIPPPGTARIIQNVPFFPQEAYQCGPASLAGVLNYWGGKVSPGEIAAEIFSAGARGTLDLDLLFYARRKGWEAVQYRGSLEDVRRNVDAGRPLIVLVDEGLWVYRKGHFMVVVGYDERGVFVNSGGKEREYLSAGKFGKSWQRAGFWTLRVTPK